MKITYWKGIHESGSKFYDIVKLEGFKKTACFGRYGAIKSAGILTRTRESDWAEKTLRAKSKRGYEFDRPAVVKAVDHDHAIRILAQAGINSRLDPELMGELMPENISNPTVIVEDENGKNLDAYGENWGAFQ